MNIYLNRINNGYRLQVHIKANDLDNSFIAGAKLPSGSIWWQYNRNKRGGEAEELQIMVYANTILQEWGEEHDDDDEDQAFAWFCQLNAGRWCPWFQENEVWIWKWEALISYRRSRRPHLLCMKMEYTAPSKM